MTVTSRSAHAAPPATTGSAVQSPARASAGFVLVALAAVLASLGVMQLEVQGAPWPAAQQQSQVLNRGARIPQITPDVRRGRAVHQDASSEVLPAAGGGLYRTANTPGH